MPHGSRCGDACAGCERNQPARATFLHSVAAVCLTRSGRSVLSSRGFLLQPLGRIAGLLAGCLPRLARCAARHLTNTADGLSRCLAQSLPEAAEPLSKTAGSLADRAF